MGYATPGLDGAVSRNRVRRRLREALRPHLERARGLDLIVSGGRTVLDMPFTRLGESVAGALDQVLGDLARRGDRSAAHNVGDVHLAPDSTRREPTPG